MKNENGSQETSTKKYKIGFHKKTKHMIEEQMKIVISTEWDRSQHYKLAIVKKKIQEGL